MTTTAAASNDLRDTTASATSVKDLAKTINFGAFLG